MTVLIEGSMEMLSMVHLSTATLLNVAKEKLSRGALNMRQVPYCGFSLAKISELIPFIVAMRKNNYFRIQIPKGRKK